MTPLIWIGEVPAHEGALYDWQIGLPGRQNAEAGLVYGEVWPISQTNEFGASCTLPHASELPIFCWLYAGISGPSDFEFRTIVPWRPVLRSLTVTWKPSLADVTNQWIVTVSPACMTSGPVAVESTSIALNAAGSWKFGFWPVAWIDQTGEQTVYVFATCLSTKPPFGVQFVRIPSG